MNCLGVRMNQRLNEKYWLFGRIIDETQIQSVSKNCRIGGNSVGGGFDSVFVLKLDK